MIVVTAGFKNDVGDAGCIVTADRMRPIDDDLDVQAVVDEEDRCGRIRATAIAAELLGVLQSDRAAVLQSGGKRSFVDRIGADVGVGAGGERHRLVEETPRPGDHALAAGGIVTLALRAFRVLRNGVEAVGTVVERAHRALAALSA